MVKTVLKRPAGAVAAAPTPSPLKKQKQKPDPVAAMCSVVSKGVQASEVMPLAVRQMLEDMLESSLGICKSERQKYQEGVVEMVADALAKVEAAHQSRIDELEANRESHGEKRAAQEAQVEEEVNRHLEKMTEMGQRKHTLAEHATSFKSAKEAVMQAEAAKTCSERAAATTARMKAELEASMQDLAKPLIEGSAPAEEVGAMSTKLTEALTKFGFGESMVVPLPTVLQKAPSDRGSFDMMVITQLDEEVKSRLQQLTATLAKGELERAKLQEAVEAAQEKFREARERQHESAQAFTVASAELTQAELSLEAEQVVLKEFAPRARENSRALAAARQALEKFREGPLKTFAALRDREPAPAPAEEAAEPAAAPAEEAAEAASDAATEAAEQRAPAGEGRDGPAAAEERA